MIAMISLITHNYQLTYDSNDYLILQRFLKVFVPLILLITLIFMIIRINSTTDSNDCTHFIDHSNRVTPMIFMITLI